MTGKTHRAGGMLCCFIGYSILQSKGLLVQGVSPIIQATVMYPFALWGSVLPDLDHNADSAPSKDIISVGINRVLHLSTKARQVKEKVTKKSAPNKPFDLKNTFDARHRSWQTHSDVFLAIFIFLFIQLFSASVQTLDICILRMIISGMTLGVISHLILDMLTPEGVWSLVSIIVNKLAGKKILKEKIQLVPDIKFFATEGPWEKLVNKVLWIMNSVYLLVLIYEMLPYRIEFNF